ncbi:uncharacterized protein LOC132299214 [Cornus florida]|uniref:uncharacterized protein LOC132299214 n=1 Tax=Cornus florida TaxID=4283 RepID=UPI0028A0CF14|nr:uncharacterized protein LOC132299214 [Cornus florida]
MRCKKHLLDLSSSVGVCATCLRERLVALIAAQDQVQAQVQAQAQAWQAQEDRRKSDALPPPLIFPRSVSPYVSRRKSDYTAWNHHLHNNSVTDQRFYSTPQVGPNGSIVTASSYHKKQSKFSLFANLFRSKSEVTDSDSRDACAATLSSSSSPSWFSSILPGRRKKQSQTFVNESTVSGGRRSCRNRDRGMSPVGYVEDVEDEECYGGSSGYSSESSQGWRQTPRRAGAAAARRGGGGGGRQTHSRTVSGMAFCLSPLVRASPHRQWNSQKVMTPDMGCSGEIRVPMKPHLSTAASNRANRSRKLVDFGRLNHN